MIRCFQLPKLVAIHTAITSCVLTVAPLITNAQSNAQPSASTLVVSGVVVAVHQAALTSRMPAKIAAVNVTENRKVHRGQMLVQLDDSGMRAQLNSARAALTGALALQQKASAGRAAQQVKADSDVSAAENGLKDAQHKRDSAVLAKESIIAATAADRKAAELGVAKATLSLDHDRKTLTNLETLDKVGGVSRNDLDNARMQVTLAQADLVSAEADLNRITEGPGGVSFRVALAQADVGTAELGVKQAETALHTAIGALASELVVADNDIRSAEASVLQARAGINSAADAVSAMRIISPIDGIASTVGARVGETAQPGVPLVTIVSLKDIKVEALILARNIPGIRVGMHVSLSVDTHPGRALDAIVSEIANVAEPDQRSVRVWFRLTSNTMLRPGLAATIRIGSRE
jgi:multidrug resistance efflux pump